MKYVIIAMVMMATPVTAQSTKLDSRYESCYLISNLVYTFAKLRDQGVSQSDVYQRYIYPMTDERVKQFYSAYLNRIYASSDKPARVWAGAAVSCLMFAE